MTGDHDGNAREKQRGGCEEVGRGQGEGWKGAERRLGGGRKEGWEGAGKGLGGGREGAGRDLKEAGLPIGLHLYAHCLDWQQQGVARGGGKGGRLALGLGPHTQRLISFCFSLSPTPSLPTPPIWPLSKPEKLFLSQTPKEP